MKTALALAALLALAAPAVAQEAGAPGATGVGGSLTGSNPGTGFGSDYYGPRPYAGPGPYVEYGPGPYDEPGMIEGRAAAPLGDMADPVPRTVRGDQNGQDLAR
jgi:hypothetical protein